MSGEFELRWRVTNRWRLVGFGGVGGTVPRVSNEGAIVARLLRIEVGLDVARGPEETIFYIQTGYAWGDRWADVPAGRPLASRRGVPIDVVALSEQQ